MDPNRFEGTASKVTGRVEQAAGNLTGDNSLRARGQARAMAGNAQVSVGQALDELRGFTTDQPLAALLAAGGVGMLVGMLMGRR